MARASTVAGLRSHASLRENAQRIAVARLAELYSFVPAIRDVTRVQELHDMRIAAKRLRYSLEIFRVCFGPEIGKRIDDVKEIQEQIGAIHDCDVLVELLHRHLAVWAQREQERLTARASEPGPVEARLAQVRAALQESREADPRLGILALLARKLDERSRRYERFLAWWDKHEPAGMRAGLLAGITAEPAPPVEARQPA